MPLLLDTSAAIALRDGEPSVLRRVERLAEPALLSVITVVELFGGVVRLSVGREQRRAALEELLGSLEILAFEQDEAESYGRILAAVGFSRTKVLDRMIAAQAIVASATLATLNPRDFRGIPGLTIEDWSA